jgi:hypothetical protein
MAGFDPSSWRKWIVPMAVTGSIAVVFFFGLFAVDHYFTGGPAGGAQNPAIRYLKFDPDHITDAVSALGGMIAAVLGIVITVVSIVVQLSAERYHGVAGMFLRDRLNIGVMGYYVVTCVSGVLVSLSVHADFAPRVTLVGMMMATTFGLVLMAPYFAYVFWFLEPTNIIARIRSQALKAFKSGASSKSAARLEETQQHVLQAMEELTDISSNSIEGKDKIIASGAVDAIKDFTVGYLGHKKKTRAEWFELTSHIRANPDVVALDPEAREELVERRTWVEWKAMRQFLGIYNEALAPMPDINHLIAIDTRYIGEAAADAADEQAMLLTFRYMNSYLRATLNAKNVRTAYNVLNQYRQLVEAMMKKGFGKIARGAFEHMKYYGHVSYDMKLPFVTETIAYDMGNLCEVAHQLAMPEQDVMLATFLELDAHNRKSEQALKGVRKAQVKLAAYYLALDDRERARRIYTDMEHDPPERLAAIRDELARVETKDFWEIVDRGRNFEFMPPFQKAAMGRFFAWFEGADSEGMAGTGTES